MRIAYVLPLSAEKIIPGIDVFEYEKTRRFLEYAINLTKMGFETRYYRYHLSNEVRVENYKGVNIYFLPVTLDTRSLDQTDGEYSYSLLKHIKSFRPDIVHCFGSVAKNFWYVWFIAKLSGAAFVAEHCGALNNPHLSRKKLSLSNNIVRFHNFLLTQTDAILANNRREIGGLQNIDVDKNKIYSIVPTGTIEVENNFRKVDKLLASTKSGIDSSKINLLYVGAIETGERSPFPLLIVLKTLLKSNDKYRLVVIGAGRHRDRFVKLIKKNKLEKFVTLSGDWVKSKEKLNLIYNSCDIFILPFITDSIGIGSALREAVTCNLDCIVYSSKKHNDQYLNYVEPNNTAQMVSTIIEIVLNKSKKVSRIEEIPFKKEKVLKDLVGLYKYLTSK